MSGEQVVVTARVSTELRDAFQAACKARDVTISQVLRQAMRSFVAMQPGEDERARPDLVQFDADAYEATDDYPGAIARWEDGAGYLFRAIVAASGQYYVIQSADIEGGGVWTSWDKQEGAQCLLREASIRADAPENIMDIIRKLPEEPSDYPGLPFKPGRTSAGNA